LNRSTGALGQNPQTEHPSDSKSSAFAAQIYLVIAKAKRLLSLRESIAFGCTDQAIGT